MKFGIESYNGLSEQDFTYSQKEQPVLPGYRATTNHLYIGMPKWGSKQWLGKLYPPNTREKDFLKIYAEHFNCIELNATHYKIAGHDEIKKWTGIVGHRDFKFCPKMYKGITHSGTLKGKAFAMDQFLRSVNNFKEQLGPIFIQVAETFSPKRIDELFDFLDSLPQEHKYFLELRNKEWFISRTILDDVIDKLKKLNIGFVIADTPNRREVAYMLLTIPEVFVRFSCFGDHELDKYRIKQWEIQLEDWFEKGLQTCWFFLHVQKEALAIDFAKFVQTALNKSISK